VAAIAIVLRIDADEMIKVLQPEVRGAPQLPFIALVEAQLRETGY